MLLAYSVTLYTSLYVHVFYKELTITINNNLMFLGYTPRTSLIPLRIQH